MLPRQTGWCTPRLPPSAVGRRRSEALHGIAAALACLALAAAGCGGAAAPPSAASPLRGKPVPRIERQDLSGDVVTVDGAPRGIVVVKFFAKYCEPCKKTLPEAQAIAESGDALVIGVSEDESEAEARAVVAEYGLTFPVVHDRGRALAGRFRVTDLPATFVAKDGTIAWVGGPEHGADDLRSAVDAIQGER